VDAGDGGRGEAEDDGLEAVRCIVFHVNDVKGALTRAREIPKMQNFIALQ
jgi:hypothetical protein